MCFLTFAGAQQVNEWISDLLHGNVFETDELDFTLYRHELFNKIDEYKGYYDEVLPSTFESDYHEQIE